MNCVMGVGYSENEGRSGLEPGRERIAITTLPPRDGDRPSSREDAGDLGARAAVRVLRDRREEAPLLRLLAREVPGHDRVVGVLGGSVVEAAVDPLLDHRMA